METIEEPRSPLPGTLAPEERELSSRFYRAHAEFLRKSAQGYRSLARDGAGFERDGSSYTRSDCEALADALEERARVWDGRSWSMARGLGEYANKNLDKASE